MKIGEDGQVTRDDDTSRQDGGDDSTGDVIPPYDEEVLLLGRST